LIENNEGRKDFPQGGGANSIHDEDDGVLAKLAWAARWATWGYNLGQA
jgi:hypothetical protein